MTAYFVDTSTVVKRYVREIGTSWVQALAAPAAGHSPIVVRITLAETVAAVTRRERGGRTSPQEAARALGISTSISPANTSSSRCRPG